MRRKISKLLMTGAVILFALLIPTVLAEKHIAVSGTWAWSASGITARPAGGNMHISATEHDLFSGTFAGTGLGPFKMTFHAPSQAHPNGFYAGSGKTVFTGTVDSSHSGSCVIKWVGNTLNDQDYWGFKWIIISGTGGLVNLRGSGYCYGPGPSGVTMTGKIHFDPS